MAKVSIRPGRGKLRGRHCVVVAGVPPTPKMRRAFKGAKPSSYRFMGCFTERSKAGRAAERAARRFGGRER